MTKQEQIAIDVYQEHTLKYVDLKMKWAELLLRYENELRAGSITAETQSKTRLGQAFSLVENFVSRIIAQVPRFHYLPRETDDVEFVDQYEEFNEYQHDIANSKEAYEAIAKWGAICGLSGYKMGWEVEQIVHKKKGKEVFGKVITNPTLLDVMDRLKLGKSVKVDDNETISNWTLDPVAPYDLVWSASAINRDDCYVLGHRIHGKTFKQLRLEGYDTKKLSQRIRNDENYWKQLTDRYKNTAVPKILDMIEVEIAELYVKYLNDKGVWEFWVVTLGDVAEGNYAGTPVPVRTEKNPFDKQFCPVGIFRPIKRPGKLYAFGIIEPVMGVLNTEEDSLNMVMEAFWTDVARPMEYVPDNLLDESALEYKPRTLVPVRKLGESVRVMETPKPDMGSAAYLMNFLERTKQNITAITDYQTGANQVQKNQTATEVRTKSFLSEQRSNKIMQAFEAEVLELSGKMALWLNKQYLADQKEIIYRVLGRKGRLMEKKMKLKVVEAIKDVVIVSGSSVYVDRSEELSRWMALYQLAVGEAKLGPAGIPMEREKIVEKIMERGYGIKDPENYIPSLQEREEAGVNKKLADREQALQENQDPINARVMPDDDPKVHLPLHQAALRNGGDGQPYTPEQMQAMTEHINEHVRLSGGAVPQFSQNIEGAMGQRINSNINPNESAGLSNTSQRGGATTGNTAGAGQ
jgi:hypothetical protein